MFLEIIKIGELSCLLFGKEERRVDISFHINLKTWKPNIICLGHHLSKISWHSIPKENCRFPEQANFLCPILQIYDFLKDRSSIKIARYSRKIDGREMIFGAEIYYMKEGKIRKGNWMAGSVP